MVVLLLGGITRMITDSNWSSLGMMRLRGVATAVLISMCVFANTTGFFRGMDQIQTPLASLLTSTFMVALGTATGVYAGSYLVSRAMLLGRLLPTVFSLGVVLAMYFGQGVMMGGDLYRFGTGWLFTGLAHIVVAPIDIIVVIVSGAATWFIMGLARRHSRRPGNTS
jgi:hypothetical protein